MMQRRGGGSDAIRKASAKVESVEEANKHVRPKNPCVCFWHHARAPCNLHNPTSPKPAE